MLPRDVSRLSQGTSRLPHAEERNPIATHSKSRWTRLIAPHRDNTAQTKRQKRASSFVQDSSNCVWISRRIDPKLRDASGHLAVDRPAKHHIALFQSTRPRGREHWFVTDPRPGVRSVDVTSRGVR